MELGAISLLILLAVIAIGFFRKVNVGLVAILAAILLGFASGLFTANQIISGFSSSLFMTLAGVTMVFAIVNSNKSLELLIKKIVSKMGRMVSLVPVVFFIFAWAVSASGPGLIPTAALVAVIAIPLAKQTGFNPVMLAMIGVHAANAGRFTMMTTEGNLVTDLLSEQGYMENIMVELCLSVTILAAVLSVITWACYKSWKVRDIVNMEGADEKFTRNQILSLIGMLAMVLLILIGKMQTGLAAFLVAAVLILLGVANEKDVFKSMPWGTIIMVLGVGILMNLVIEVGGIELLSKYLASVMTPRTASALSGLTAGVMSWFSSTLGVVIPTLVPTVSHIVESIGGGVTALEITAAIVFASSTAGLSPASTAGSLILSGVIADPDYKNTFKEEKLFVQLFLWAAVGIVIIALFALAGYLKLFV